MVAVAVAVVAAWRFLGGAVAIEALVGFSKLPSCTAAAAGGVEEQGKGKAGNLLGCTWVLSVVDWLGRTFLWFF
jgi:hypothetical protein